MLLIYVVVLVRVVCFEIWKSFNKEEESLAFALGEGQSCEDGQRDDEQHVASHARFSWQCKDLWQVALFGVNQFVLGLVAWLSARG